MELLKKIETGFAGLQITAEKKAAALENLEEWVTAPEFEDYVHAIEHLVDGEAWDLLLYNFFQTLPFGTGGRRGPVGVGPNTYNAFTLCSSVQGHVNFLRQKFGDIPLRVVLAFDVRQFLDLKGRYMGLENNPVQGLRSRDFARFAAEVYAANGVEVHLPDPEGEWILSTPELSYAIRALNAHGGLNVSASHNHPDDNGGKFYDEKGGQEVPPNDEIFSELVEKVRTVSRTSFDEGRSSGRIQFMDHESIHRGYVNLNVGLSQRPEARGIKVVLTNLHGAGDTNVGDVLTEAGFEVHYVPEQREHDGQFPNVPYRIANPEVPESMDMAVALARSIGADAVLSTDPDADRIGIMAPDADGNFRFFTGNELGALVTDQVFRCRQVDGSLPENPLFVTTEVTSRLPVAVAKSYGAKTVDNLLVGCKYIANVISELETVGKFRDFVGGADAYVMGLEESHGLMVCPSVRDKDAAGGALILAERVAEEKASGNTLADALDNLYRRVGIHLARQVSIVIEGAVGMEKIAAMQSGFRELKIGDRLGGRPILSRDDFLDEETHGEFLSGTDKKARNFISFVVEGGLRVLVRPSGTEPKIKLYCEIISSPCGDDMSPSVLQESKEALLREMMGVMDAVAQQGYSLLGLDIPVYGLRCSPLMGLDARMDFATVFVGELREKVLSGTTTAALGLWVDSRIESYGKDSRSLIKGGIREWILSQGELLTKDQKASIADIFSL